MVFEDLSALEVALMSHFIKGNGGCHVNRATVKLNADRRTNQLLTPFQHVYRHDAAVHVNVLVATNESDGGSDEPEERSASLPPASWKADAAFLQEGQCSCA